MRQALLYGVCVFLKAYLKWDLVKSNFCIDFLSTAKKYQILLLYPVHILYCAHNM